MSTLGAFDKVMKGLGKTGEALGEGAGRVKAGVDNHFARYADDPTPYSGYLADQAAALGAVARHALGGGLIAGGANAVAYQNGAAWTGAESVGSAFMGGAAYGAVGGAALGATRFGIYSKANQIDRMVAHKSANKVGQTGMFSGVQGRLAIQNLQESMPNVATRKQLDSHAAAYKEAMRKGDRTTGDFHKKAFGNLKGQLPQGAL